ncbi:response regulator [Flavobacterium sp. C4GT6]|uniref:response regulator n=1 Tax=Flavobacterium sp. C4GT6 TaxID=3103818 RepID=UPI002ED1C083
MNILIVDDHPLTLSIYKNILKDFYSNSSFDLLSNSEQAYKAIIAYEKKNIFYDLAILDYNIPAYDNITNGADLIKIIRDVNKSTKALLITAHQEVVLIYDIIKKIAPDGIAIKNDISIENLGEITNIVLAGSSYHSPTVRNCVFEVLKKDIMMEDYNRQILFYLSRGYKVKDLKDVVLLTTSSIQRRVANMKKVFKVEDDSSLVKTAIQQGFV